MPEGEEDTPKVRSMFFTYEATDGNAETFMIVMGSIAENFRGINIVEYQDDSVFAEDQPTIETLHQLVTAAKQLTPEQQEVLAQFTTEINQWTGDESP